MSDRKFETKWVQCAGFEPALGHRVPQPLEDWGEAMEGGWEPAGHTIMLPNVKGGVIIFAMVKRPVSRIIVPDIYDLREIQ